MTLLRDIRWFPDDEDSLADIGDHQRPRVAPSKKPRIALLVCIAVSLLLCLGCYLYGASIDREQEATTARLQTLQNAVAHRDDYIASIEASLTATNERAQTLSTRLEDSEIAAAFYKEQATSATVETMKAGQ